MTEYRFEKFIAKGKHVPTKEEREFYSEAAMWLFKNPDIPITSFLTWCIDQGYVKRSLSCVRRYVEIEKTKIYQPPT